MKHLRPGGVIAIDPPVAQGLDRELEGLVVDLVQARQRKFLFLLQRIEQSGQLARRRRRRARTQVLLEFLNRKHEDLSRKDGREKRHRTHDSGGNEVDGSGHARP